jgi:hypothetical protein
MVLLIAGATMFAGDPIQKEDSIRIAEEITSVTTYTVASPRAFLMGIPIEGADDLAMIGAAENFTRADGTLEIPVNTRVIFSLSQGTEGVWQQGTYGTIETAMTVQWFQAVAQDECDLCASAGLRDPDDQTGQGDDASCPWTTAGTDGARDTRNGPSLGYTKVGVPVEFTQAGTYCVRALVSTSVRSSYLRAAEPQNPTTKQEVSAQSSDELLAVDTDVVLVKVRVLAATAKPQGALTSDPEVIYTTPMPNTSDTKARADEDTNKDSGAVK